MKLQVIHETRLGDIGHAALDVAGFVPGLGEAADLTNALWYAKEGQYVSAVLSLISMVPEVGDVIGKGFKYSPRANRFLAQKFGPHIKKLWPKIKDGIAKMDAWRPHIQKLEEAVLEIINNPNS